MEQSPSQISMAELSNLQYLLIFKAKYDFYSQNINKLDLKIFEDEPFVFQK